ncbi:MAG TPA: hypothetical protein VKY37_04865, partial [Brumimicrobium sp.]|nr:hypothetical protein [Brumimicrobium sp.]
YYQTYLQKMSNVSQEDILSLGKNYITPNNYYIIVVGNKEILEKIKKFDADGKVTVLDAYGNPAKEKVLKPADISKSEVLENYLMAVTQTTSIKKANKKIKKIKTLAINSVLVPDQAPVEIEMLTYFKAPNKQATKITLQGMMVLQHEKFNGSEGVNIVMNETGGTESLELTKEEVEDKKKTSAVFLEHSLLCNLDDIQLLGIQSRDGFDLYVIEYTIGKQKTTAYYNQKTALKEYSTSIESTEEGPQTLTYIHSEYTDYSGYLFPKKTSQVAGGEGLNGTIKSIEINGDIDDEIFEVK